MSNSDAYTVAQTDSSAGGVQRLPISAASREDYKKTEEWFRKFAVEFLDETLDVDRLFTAKGPSIPIEWMKRYFIGLVTATPQRMKLPYFATKQSSLACFFHAVEWYQGRGIKEAQKNTVRDWMETTMAYEVGRRAAELAGPPPRVQNFF